jgi:Xaa-Pro dipeptidase
VQDYCTLQATGCRNGLYATASRTVSFGPVPAEYRAEYDAACKLAAVMRSLSAVEETNSTAAEAAKKLLTGGAFEFEERFSPPGYGTGRVGAEELRRAGQDEKFAPGSAIVWQPRVGRAAAVDTVLVTDRTCTAVTPPDAWPYKRITIKGTAHDIPDILVRTV